jgi:hypothetical protein
MGPQVHLVLQARQYRQVLHWPSGGRCVKSLEHMWTQACRTQANQEGQARQTGRRQAAQQQAGAPAWSSPLCQAWTARQMPTGHCPLPCCRAQPAGRTLS